MYTNIIISYLQSLSTEPFFFVTGDKDYLSVLENIKLLALNIVRLSDFCNGDDKFPDIDKLFEFLGSGNNNLKNNNFAILGLGELLELRGEKETIRILSKAKDIQLIDKKVIFFMRGVSSYLKELQNDIRFDNRHLYIDTSVSIDFSITITDKYHGLKVYNGIKSLLKALEDGTTGNFFLKSDMKFDKSLRRVNLINSAYTAIKHLLPEFNIPLECGEETKWRAFLNDLSENNNSTKKMFENYDFDIKLHSDFYNKISSNSYKNWLYYIYLKMQVKSIANEYLQIVLNDSLQFDNFRLKILNMISKLSTEEENYQKYYDERKELISSYPEPDIASFVLENRKNYESSVLRLTDNTITEKQEIISWVSKYGMIPEISKIYPALFYYLKKYIFNCGELSTLLTSYFDEYKQQKVFNKIEDSFLSIVDELSKKREFHRLVSREATIEKFNIEDTYLLWVDALGVEYLSYITRISELKNLSLDIKICKAELPTLTSLNRGFYDNWKTDLKEKIDDLDEVKHKAKGGYNFTRNELPIHLAEELEIIEKIVNQIATKLSSNKYKRILVVSDHGASRLAVLRKKEEKYETETKGEHSGRCCKYFDGYDLPFAAEKNGYLCLADYGRFKGSRAANVEVHGGASLEEVVIPIIEFSLKKGQLNIELMSEDITVDFKKGCKIKLFSNIPLKNVSINFSGDRYLATVSDVQHYEVVLPNLKKAGTYSIEVFSGDDFIKEFSITTKSKIGSENKDFNLF